MPWMPTKMYQGKYLILSIASQMYCLSRLPSYLNWFRQLPKPVTSPPWHSWTRKWGLFLWCSRTVLEVCTVPSPAAPGPQISRVANPNVSKLSKLSNFKLRIARISLHRKFIKFISTVSILVCFDSNIDITFCPQITAVTTQPWSRTITNVLAQCRAIATEIHPHCR